MELKEVITNTFKELILPELGIEKEDILAALEYAAQIISNEEVGDLAVA